MTDAQSTLHIYPLSKLVGSPAPEWEKILKELEADEKHLYRYYQPMREAVVCLVGGSIERNRIVEVMLASCETIPHGPYQKVSGDNLTAFESFEAHFHNRVESLTASLLRTQ